MADRLFMADEIPPERDVEQMSPRDMSIIEAMHGVAQRHNIGLVCARCLTPFQGYNNTTDATHTIMCNCREIRATSHANPSKN
jgi:hypothetical protein